MADATNDPGQNAAQQPSPAADKRSRWWRWPLWLLLALVALVVALPFALYIPWVQNKVAQYACRKASEATGMDIGLDRILIEWPLDVSIDGLRAVQPDGDTLLAADNLTARLQLLPLLDKQVRADSAWLTGARLHIVTADSSVNLRAVTQRLDVGRADVDLGDNTVNVDNATLNGGDISLTYLADKVVDKPDDEPAAPWHITARHLALRDVNYTMDMLPTFDNLAVRSGNIDLYDGLVDTGKQVVKAGGVVADSLNVGYRYPTAADAARYAAAHPLPPSKDNGSGPWTVDVDSVRLSHANASYVMTGHRPAAGIDPDHIAVTDVSIAVDSISNRGVDTRLTVRHLAANERSGLRLTDASGTVAVDSTGVDLDGVKVKTLLSDIALDGRVDYDALADNPTGTLRLDTDGHIALQEVARAVPSLKPVLDGVPQVKPLAVRGNIAGNRRAVRLSNVRADMPHYVNATVSGTINNPLDPDRLGGTLDFDANLANIDFVKPLALSPDMQRQVNLPPMRVKGSASLNGSAISADATMTLANNGQTVGRVRFDSTREDYDIDMTMRDMPVKAILPMYGIGNVTGSVRASGTGLDFTNPSSAVDAHIDIQSAQFNGTTYRNVRFDGRLGAGSFDGRLLSKDSNCDADVDINGSINGSRYVVNATGRIYDIDMQAMGLTQDVCNGKGLVDLHCDMDMARKTGDIAVNITDMEGRVGGNRFVADGMSLTATATESSVNARFDNEDNHVTLDAACSVDTLLARLSRTADVAASLIRRRALDIDTLQQALPPFSLQATLGRDGVVQRMAAEMDIDFRDASMSMRNDTAFFADGYIHAVSIGTTTIDTLTLNAGQWKGRYLAFKAHMGNRRGTMDDFASVDVVGGIKGSTIDFLATQQDINRKTGYRLGCNATLTDTAVVTRLFPQEMTIGYRKWRINENNYANFNYRTRMLDADIDLRSDSSTVRLLTERAPGATTENIHIDVDNLQLAEWTQFLTALPPVAGRLDINADVAFDGTNVEGSTTMSLKDFTYNKRRAGNLAISSTYTVDPGTATTVIDADMTVDGEHVALFSGSLNESDASSPLNIDVDLYRFPLRRAAAFIPGRMLSMRGYVSGTLKATGTLDAPMLSGTLTPDSASVTAPLYSAQLRLSDSKLTLDRNLLRFDNYKLYGVNDAPVTINGNISLRDFDNPSVNLDIAGTNVQVVNGEQRSFTELFGKGFVDATARVRTFGRRLDINASIDVLNSSNVTYVIQDEVRSLTNNIDEDMVTFVNLNDSTDTFTAALMTAAQSMSLNILANIAVEQGTRLNAYLSTDGKDRANVVGEGKFKYRLDFAGKNDFTGSYTIESGEVRYTPPVISQKNFNITPGSSVTWTGNILNPTLDLRATNRVKTNVSNDDGNTLVNFDVTAILGGNLDGIKLSFDMSADDMSVQNDLQSMSVEQRSQTAINMLLYNTYSGNNAANNINNLTAGSALFSFVNSKINDWAGKIIKGVDLQLGINQYEGQNKSGIQTSYSYRLTKSLFNDRFKIVVGGEYSTDATTSESIANNLLSEVSLEYLLTSSGNMLVRLFRHTDFESVLEGQVSKIGVGFVYKHKLARLDQMFRRNKKRSLDLPPDTIQSNYFTVPLDTVPRDTVPHTTPRALPADSLSTTRQQDNEPR